MRGFVIGSLGLIALYVGVQPRGAKAATVGGNALVSLLRRALSPDVAGLPNRRFTSTTNSSTSTTTTTGGTWT